MPGVRADLVMNRVVVVFIHGLIGGFEDPRALSCLDAATILTPRLHGYGPRDASAGDDITIDRQVDFVRRAIDLATPNAGAVLVAHSVGAVIATAFAHAFPEQVRAIVNVEGNFKLDDAFLSRRFANQTASELDSLLQLWRSDPQSWLRENGVRASTQRIAMAHELIDFQSGATLRAMARAVLEYTGGPRYEQILREACERTSLHLVAGTRSRAGWHVPEWALERANSYTEIRGSGHMVMLEAPRAFGMELRRILKLEQAADLVV